MGDVILVSADEVGNSIGKVPRAETGGILPCVPAPYLPGDGEELAEFPVGRVGYFTFSGEISESYGDFRSPVIQGRQLDRFMADAGAEIRNFSQLGEIFKIPRNHPLDNALKLYYPVAQPGFQQGLTSWSMTTRRVESFSQEVVSVPESTQQRRSRHRRIIAPPETRTTDSRITSQHG